MRLDCGGMEFEKLADLLELGQFELIGLPEGEAGKIPSDIRLVYMMNDTAESFLVFHEAVMTGTYLPEYEGELRAALDREESDRSGKMSRKVAAISWQFIREIQSAHYSSKRSHWNVNCMTMAISDIFG